MEDRRRDQGPSLTGGLRTSADTSQGGGDNSAAKQTPPLPASYKDWGNGQPLPGGLRTPAHTRQGRDRGLYRKVGCIPPLDTQASPGSIREFKSKIRGGTLPRAFTLEGTGDFQRPNLSVRTLDGFSRFGVQLSPPPPSPNLGCINRSVKNTSRWTLHEYLGLALTLMLRCRWLWPFRFGISAWEVERANGASEKVALEPLGPRK